MKDINIKNIKHIAAGLSAVFTSVLLSITGACTLTGCGDKDAGGTESTVAQMSDPETTFSQSDVEEATATDESVGETASAENDLADKEQAKQLSRTEAVIRTFGYKEGAQLLSAPPDIVYQYSDDSFEYYTFAYGNNEFIVLHEYDNWQIKDSYLVQNTRDMEMIAQALIDIYPVHGIDLESYRTPEDMVYEWIQHNIVCELEEGAGKWRDSAKSVDLDPDEQNMNLWEIYQARKNDDQVK